MTDKPTNKQIRKWLSQYLLKQSIPPYYEWAEWVELLLDRLEKQTANANVLSHLYVDCIAQSEAIGKEE